MASVLAQAGLYHDLSAAPIRPTSYGRQGLNHLLLFSSKDSAWHISGPAKLERMARRPWFYFALKLQSKLLTVARRLVRRYFVCLLRALFSSLKRSEGGVGVLS